jgi:aminoglycoside 3-N-acetyltransferase
MKDGAALFTRDGKTYRQSDLMESIEAVGIKRGDTVIVRSDVTAFGVPAVASRREICSPLFLGAIADCFIEAVGPSGTLMMPAYTYSFCEGREFDVKRSPSTVGLLTEYFRKMPGVTRTLEPIFSMAIYGAGKKYFSEISNSCFGEGSIYDKIYARGAKMAAFGLAQREAITAIHYAEARAKVPYRFDKTFSGVIVDDDENRIPSEFIFFVRRIDEPSICKIERTEEVVKSNACLREATFAGGPVSSFDYSSFVDDFARKLKTNPYHFVV